ncbi:MAG: hypothetical protein PHC34_09735 [Candidatus Gastranaerophilales bacterium]|nr:hypothetical protein [Candidatus Gastranaerophilales bacterium]
MISNSFKVQNQTSFGSKFAVKTFPVENVQKNLDKAQKKINKRNILFNRRIDKILWDLKNYTEEFFNDTKAKFNSEKGLFCLTVDKGSDFLVENELIKLKRHINMRQLFTKKQDKVELTWTKE